MACLAATLPPQVENLRGRLVKIITDFRTQASQLPCCPCLATVCLAPSPVEQQLLTQLLCVPCTLPPCVAEVCSNAEKNERKMPLGVAEICTHKC